MTRCVECGHASIEHDLPGPGGDRPCLSPAPTPQNRWRFCPCRTFVAPESSDA